MFDFLVALIVVFLMIRAIHYGERVVLEYRKVRKLGYVEAQRKIYNTYRLIIDDFVIRYEDKTPKEHKPSMFLEIYPVVSKLYEISSTQTPITVEHHHVFTTPQADVLPLFLPGNVDTEYSLEPMLTETIFSSPLATSRKEVNTWFEDFMEEHGVPERSLSIVDKGFQYRYRVNLVNVPCTDWWEQIPLEITAWQDFPGMPKIQFAVTGL